MNHPEPYTCEEVFRLLDDYLDRELSREEMRKVREHLELCATCAAEHQFQAELLCDMRERIQRIALPPSLRDKIMEALRQAERA